MDNNSSMRTSKEWLALLKPYEGGDDRRAAIQFATTLGLYLAALTTMLIMLVSGLPYWSVLLLAIPTGGLHVRIFIIMHDCGHNSYFRTKRASRIVGRVCSIITFTPYYDWLRSHAIHHATVSDLDRRGIGDIWTMTVEEYRSSGPGRKLLYRIYRNPIFLLGVGPLLLFLVVFRFPQKKTFSKRNVKSIIYTDLVLAAIVTGFALTIGIGVYLMAILPVLLVASISGVWLFFVQHQYQEVYWDRSKSWNSVRAALEGSSYYKLPGILRWFSGNIGFHHIHHLSPKIPNYNLKRCYNEVPGLDNVTPITISKSLRSLFLQLWDEKTRKLVNFGLAGRRVAVST